MAFYIRPKVNTAVLSPKLGTPEFCRLSQDGADQGSIKLLVLVISEPESFETRHAIRRTWLPEMEEEQNHPGIVVKVVFLLGMSLNETVQVCKKH